MKTIFLGDAARDSGSFGFSEAWPLEETNQVSQLSSRQWQEEAKIQNSPASPDGMDVHALGNVDNQLDVGIVVVICAAGDFDVVVSHSNVVGVCL